jgi:aspartyl-tRNA(Asn)/glutamyl-tRNA(Gln) amidotransferase subunit C
MVLITIKEVEHVAKLARLELSEEEKTQFMEQLSKIIGYFNQLDEVNTEGIEPMAHSIPMVNVMREDIACDANLREEILNNAPQEENGYFRVPRITED